jgi:hypothetical protein
MQSGPLRQHGARHVIDRSRAITYAQVRLEVIGVKAWMK